MNLIMDGLLVTGTFFAGIYCWILAGRVRELKALDRGLGGSIVTLTRQIELARATLEEARAGSRETRQDLTQLVARADTAAAQLKLLIAAVREPEPPAADVVALAPTLASAPVTPILAPVPVAPALAPIPAAEVLTPALAEAPAPMQALRPVADVPRPDRPAIAEVPKPRPVKLENILRKRGETAVRSEDEILETLSAIAGGGR